MEVLSVNLAHSGVRHAAPVLERTGYQRVRREHDDGIVPVLHLDYGERHVDDHAVGYCRRHYNPVADAQHIVARELYAGHESEYRVLENQHQSGGEGTESAKKSHRRLVDEYRHADYGYYNPYDTFRHVHHPLEGMILLVGVTVVVVPHETDYGVASHAEHDGEIYVDRPAEECKHRRGVVEREREQCENDKRRYDVRALCHNLLIEKLFAEIALAELNNLAHDIHYRSTYGISEQ